MSVKGPALLREQNEKKVLNLLRKYKQTSRNDLAKLMGVSKNTTSIIIDFFIKQGVIREVGVEQENKVGRPKIMIALRPEAFKAIGITLGQGRIEYVVTDYMFNQIHEGTQQVESNEFEVVISQIGILIEQLTADTEDIIGIGIGVPGVVNLDTGIVYESIKLQWHDVDLYTALKKYTELPIIIQNNVKMTALCVLLTNEIDENSSIFYIRIGEGIGGAFFHAGGIWNGASSTSGEIGHVSVDPNGPVCRCGQKGCLEKMISVESFAEWTNRKKDKDNFISEKQIDEQLAVYGRYLGLALISVINLINPSTIVIDSPYNHIRHFKEALLVYLKENSLKISYGNTLINFNDQSYSQSVGAAIAVITDFEK